MGKHLKPKETSKLIVWFLLANGVSWVWCSYILAYLGRADIAESLSKVALTEIVSVTLGYYLKAAFEQMSKNNRWPDKPVENKTTIERDC